jgi:hypothetical protein
MVGGRRNTGPVNYILVSGLEAVLGVEKKWRRAEDGSVGACSAREVERCLV